MEVGIGVGVGVGVGVGLGGEGGSEGGGRGVGMGVKNATRLEETAVSPLKLFSNSENVSTLIPKKIAPKT